MTTVQHRHIQAILSSLHDRVIRLENLGYFPPNQEYPMEYRDNEASQEMVTWYLNEVRTRFGDRILHGIQNYASVLDAFNLNTTNLDLTNAEKRHIKAHLYTLYHEEMHKARDTLEFDRYYVDDVMGSLEFNMNMIAAM